MQRREEIIERSAALFASKGIRATPVREIAREVGMMAGSLYHHFDSKAEIVDALLSGFFERLLSTYREVVRDVDEPLAALERLVRVAFGSVETDAAAISIVQNEDAYLKAQPRFEYVARAAHEIEEIWVRVIERGVRSGSIRYDIDPRLLYRFARDNVWVTVRWYRPDGAHSIDEIADAYVRVLLDGVRGPEPGRAAWKSGA